MNNIANLLNKIIDDNHISVFYIIANADDKKWYLPQQNLKTAINLYQPSSWIGKLLKLLFPCLKNSRMLHRLLRIRTVKIDLKQELKQILCSVFEAKDVDFAIFTGTPSNHQKITIQLFQRDKILGYCKISDNKEIAQLFSNEYNLLHRLKEKSVAQIPVSLYLGNLIDTVHIFVQNTTKTSHSKVLHKWTNLQWSFLTNIKQKTTQTLAFEQTDFCRNIRRLQANLVLFSDTEQTAINSGIQKVLENYKSATVNFSVYHGDFTPWNMFVENGQLFVFDWEYAALTYPPYLDWFHFFTQCCIFEKYFDAYQIYRRYLIQKNTLSAYVDNPDFSYLCYLLDIVSRYIERDKGNHTKEMEKSIHIWLQLISYFL
jgi:thiamine kinase-like enzyme